MTTYIAKRILLMIPTFFGVSLVVWCVLAAAPKPPVTASEPASAEQGKTAGESGTVSRAERVFRAQYGLDKPAILNFYYGLDRAEVERTIEQQVDPGGTESQRAKRKLRAAEQLVDWGYYAVPALVSIAEDREGEVQRTAVNRLLRTAQRAPRTQPGQQGVSEEQAFENLVIRYENRLLEALAELEPAADEDGSGEDLVQRKVRAVSRWYRGAHDAFPDEGAEDAAALLAEARAEELGEAEVPQLVELALGDGPGAADAARALRRIAGARSELEELAVKNVAWEQDARPVERRASRARLRDWWRGVAGRWNYGGGRWLKVMFLETRFARYWGNLLRFDLGQSSVYKEPVIDIMKRRLKYSLTLALGSLILAYLISVPLGLFSAKTHGEPVERGLSVFVFILYSLPTFFVGTLVIRYLAVGQPDSAEWIPTGGFESEGAWRLTTWERLKDIAAHIVAPMLCMTYVSLAALSRYAKTGLLNVIRSDYVRTARAKGLSEFWVTYKHAARPGIIPVITLLGGTLPVVVSGSIIIETIFNIPGFGLLIVSAVTDNDYNVIVGVTLVTAVLVMLGILLSDILYAIADPRISLE